MGCLQMLVKNLLSQELNDRIHEEALSSTRGSWLRALSSQVPRTQFTKEGFSSQGEFYSI